jgi:MCP family monocarboxylic acid transporter-like MFS transporter 10
MVQQLDIIKIRHSSEKSLADEAPSPFPSTSDEESNRSNSAAEEHPKTEGRLRAWLTVLGSCLVYFACFGIINSFGFFQNYYENEFLTGVPASAISFVGTIQLTLMNLLAAPAGSLFDCYGLKVLVGFHRQGYT